MNENTLPLVTVIVPCYNHEKYIETCLDSIFRQIYQNIEVIVIDDCSPDNSAEIIKKLQQKYDFKFIEHQENWGLTKTLNDVINNYATGKYIKCIASDDYLTNNCIQILVNKAILCGKSCAFVYGQARSFTYDKDGTKRYSKILGKDTSQIKLLFEENQIPAPAVLFDKQKFIEVGGFANIFIEDIYLWLKFANKYEFAFVEDIVCYYQLNNIESMSNNYPKMRSNMIYIISKFFIEEKSSDNQLLYDKYFDSIYEHYSGYKIQQIQKTLTENKLKAFKLYFRNLLLLIHGRRRLLLTFWFKIFKLRK